MVKIIIFYTLPKELYHSFKVYIKFNEVLQNFRHPIHFSINLKKKEKIKKKSYFTAKTKIIYVFIRKHVKKLAVLAYASAKALTPPPLPSGHMNYMQFFLHV